MNTVRSKSDLDDSLGLYPNPNPDNSDVIQGSIDVEAPVERNDDNGEESVGRTSAVLGWCASKFSRKPQHHLVPGAQALSAPSNTRAVLSEAITTGTMTKVSVTATNTAGIGICLAVGYGANKLNQNLPDVLASLGVNVKDGVVVDPDAAANVAGTQTKLDQLSQAGLLGGQLFLFLNVVPSLLNSLTYWEGIKTGSTCRTLLTNLDLEVGKLLQSGGLLLAGYGAKDQLNGDSIKGAIETTAGLVAATIGTGMVNINRARVAVRNEMFKKRNLVYTAQGGESATLVSGVGGPGNRG